MATLTIRNIDDSVITQLRIRAAEHGWSVEEEVRHILEQALSASTVKKGLGINRCTDRRHGFIT